MKKEEEESPEQVLAVAQKIIAENPSFIRAYVVQHDSLWKLKRWGELMKTAVEGYRRFPCKETLAQASWAYVVSGESEWARVLWEKGKGQMVGDERLMEENLLRKERRLDECKELLKNEVTDRARSSMGSLHLVKRESPFHYWMDEWVVVLDKPRYNLPRWGNQVQEGTRILLDFTAGIGDFFLSMRFVPCFIKYVTDRGGEVFIHARKKTTWMLTKSDFVGTAANQARIIKAEESNNEMLEKLCDCWLDAMHIPTHLYMDWVDVLEKRVDWLHYLFEGVERRTDGKKYILQWKTFDGNPDSMWRDIPTTYLPMLLEALPSTYEWLVSDHNLTGTERAILEQYDNVEIRTMDSTRAFGDTIDMLVSGEARGIISVDTSMANLGGALGVETHVLLAHTPEWRWKLSGDKTDMYPDAILHRQRTDGAWEEVIGSLWGNLGSPIAPSSCLSETVWA